MTKQPRIPKRRQRYLTRSALTLLELLVVLVILTIVATVAVSSLQPRVENARFEQTKKTMQAITDATVGVRNARQVDGTPLLSGFVADIGRAPKRLTTSVPLNHQESEPRDESDESTTQGQELGELWSPQTSLATEFPYQFRPGPKAPLDFSDIQIPCGWRGPYVHLPPGTTSLIDAWGKPFEYKSGADGSVLAIGWSPSGSFSQPIRFDLTNGKVSVTGTINADQPLPANLQVALLTPDPNSSRTALSVLADENSGLESFQFSKVPIGLRAICVTVDNQRVLTRYVQVPHEGLSLVLDLSGKFSETSE